MASIASIDADSDVAAAPPPLSAADAGAMFGERAPLVTPLLTRLLALVVAAVAAPLPARCSSSEAADADAPRDRSPSRRERRCWFASGESSCASCGGCLSRALPATLPLPRASWCRSEAEPRLLARRWLDALQDEALSWLRRRSPPTLTRA